MKHFQENPNQFGGSRHVKNQWFPFIFWVKTMVSTVDFRQWIPWDLRSSPSTASELRLVEDTPTCSQPPKVFGMMRIVYECLLSYCLCKLTFSYLDGLRCSSSDRSAKCPVFMCKIAQGREESLDLLSVGFKQR